MDRYIGRKTDKCIDRQKERNTVRKIDVDINMQINRQKCRQFQMDRYIGRKTDKCIDRQIDGQADRQRVDRQIDE